MNYQYPLTILTPSYNRADYLPTLYKSLCRQTDSNFQWLIIDDGSTDNTEEVVNGFISENNTSFRTFHIDYHKKNNGGKHTALNYSHPYIKGELVCIVDSDDWLLPHAIENIFKRQKEYLPFKNVKLLTFLRGKNPQDTVCKGFPEKPEISNHIDFRVNGKRPGDCCEVLYTEVLKEFPFPEHTGERFLGEGYLWNNAGFKYDTVYIPEIIYICEYLDGGLTKSGRKLRISCPLGGMDNSYSFFGEMNGRKVNEKTLRKEAMLFVCYGKFAGFHRKEILKRAADKKTVNRYYCLGYALYLYWKIKY